MDTEDIWDKYDDYMNEDVDNFEKITHKSKIVKQNKEAVARRKQRKNKEKMHDLESFNIEGLVD